MTQYVTLQNEDVIVVSRTLLGKVLGAFRVLTQPIRDALGFFLFFERFTDNNNNN